MYTASMNFLLVKAPPFLTHTHKHNNNNNNKKPNSSRTPGKLVGIHNHHIPNSNITVSFLEEFMLNSSRHSARAHRQTL